MSLCKYRNALGVPGTGIHSYRVFNIAIMDVIMTIIGAWLISYFFKFPFKYTLPLFFLSGIVLHKLFCVRTTVDKLLFPNYSKG